MTELVPYWNFVFDSARWAGFSFRPDDVVICTPPKSGTTWMQMLCAMLLFDAVEFDRPLPDISPWLDMQTHDPAAIVALLEARQHRRFIKTHTPCPTSATGSDAATATSSTAVSPATGET